MMPQPSCPKIYHITHVENLPSIVLDGCLLSDAAILRRGGSVREIGMSSIKRRRVTALEVACHPGTKVGDYVPFYFCPRSVMLYVIFMRNRPELSYRGGQSPIVHLEADLKHVVRWADGQGVPWAFSRTNAGSKYAEFRTGLHELGWLDWQAIAATDFRDPDVRSRKQAEFLVHGCLPFSLVERIGVSNASIGRQVSTAVAACSPTPSVEILPEWYY